MATNGMCKPTAKTMDPMSSICSLFLESSLRIRQDQIASDSEMILMQVTKCHWRQIIQAEDSTSQTV